MKTGSIVRIYQNPITRENLEGEAKIICFHKTSHKFGGDGTLYHYAAVRFLDDPDQVVDRWFADEFAESTL